MFGIVKAFKHGFIDGWNDTTNYKHLYINEPPQDPQNDDLTEEITLLEIIIERRKKAAYTLEMELTKATGKRLITITNQLNAMDKATHKDQMRLNKLKGLE